jgi:hypothetical protein
MNAMDEKDLRRLLRVQGQAEDGPGRRCPGEAEISAYVEHRLSVEDKARIESHVADCDACLEQIAFLVRPSAAEPTPAAPRLLSRARDLVMEKQAAWRAPVLRWGTVAATAVLVAFVLVRQARAPGVGHSPYVPGPDVSSSAAPPSAPGSTPPGPVTTAPAQPAAPPHAASPARPAPPQSVVRNSVVKPLQLDLAFPSENATLSIGQLEFRWKPIPGVAYYEVQLVTDDGTVVWIGKVEGIRARPPDSIRLETGRKYFVWIKAHLSGGGTVKSATVSFHIGGI